MKGAGGDRLIIKRLSTGAPSRDGEILEVHGIDGGPPYLVRWSDDGQIGLVFPDRDADIEHLARSEPSSAVGAASPSNTKSMEER